MRIAVSSSIVVVVICFLSLLTRESDAYGASKLIQLIRGRQECAAHQACRIAVCPWHQDTLEPGQDMCDYIQTPCKCAAGMTCSTSHMVPSTPEVNFITFNFVCVQSA